MLYRFCSLIAVIFMMFLCFVPMANAQQEQIAPANNVDVATSETSQNVLFIMGHYVENLHAVTMGLKLADMLADKTDVSIFLNLEAARLADKRLPRDFSWRGSPTVDELLTRLLEKNVSIIVCPHCASSAGVTEDALLDGMVIATPEEVTQMVISADKVINY